MADVGRGFVTRGGSFGLAQAQVVRCLHCACVDAGDTSEQAPLWCSNIGAHAGTCGTSKVWPRPDWTTASGHGRPWAMRRDGAADGVWCSERFPSTIRSSKGDEGAVWLDPGVLGRSQHLLAIGQVGGAGTARVTDQARLDLSGCGRGSVHRSLLGRRDGSRDQWNPSVKRAACDPSSGPL